MLQPRRPPTIPRKLKLALLSALSPNLFCDLGKVPVSRLGFWGNKTEDENSKVQSKSQRAVALKGKLELE